MGDATPPFSVELVSEYLACQWKLEPLLVGNLEKLSSLLVKFFCYTPRSKALRYATASSAGIMKWLDHCLPFAQVAFQYKYISYDLRPLISSFPSWWQIYWASICAA